VSLTGELDQHRPTFSLGLCEAGREIVIDLLIGQVCEHCHGCL
jgi:hypothetical protein